MESETDFSKFRQLLATIENEDVMIRIRCAGEKWRDFSSVLLLSENAMILQENAQRRIIMNLKNVAEFEVNKPCLDFEADVCYTIAGTL